MLIPPANSEKSCLQAQFWTDTSHEPNEKNFGRPHNTEANAGFVTGDSFPRKLETILLNFSDSFREQG